MGPKSICDHWGSLQLALPKQLVAKGLAATASTVSNFGPFQTQECTPRKMSDYVSCLRNVNWNDGRIKPD